MKWRENYADMRETPFDYTVNKMVSFYFPSSVGSNQLVL